MGKFIFGKKSEDTYYHTFKNEFHIFSFCYGVYLTYKESQIETSFKDYLFSKKDLFLTNWHFVNKTHNYIKTKNKKIKKKELRKLGYSGIASTPMCPLIAPDIQNEMFKLLDDEDFSNVYYKFLKENWDRKISSNSLLKYNIPNDIDSSVNNTFHNYIGFQRRVLLQSEKESGKITYYRLKDNSKYTIINSRITDEKN